MKVWAVFLLGLSLVIAPLNALAAPEPATSTALIAAPLADVVYIVRPGDTLFGIAGRFGTTVAAIAARNGISNVNQIFVGERLIIPSGGPGPTPPPAVNHCIYIVQPGDTLSAIAARFGTSVAALVAANGIANPNVIFVGERLRLPNCRPLVTQCPRPVGSTINITQPASGAVVSSPIPLQGTGGPAFENQLAARVVTRSGLVVGNTTVFLSATPGSAGPFNTSISFSLPAGINRTSGCVEVFDTSAKDGSIIALTAVAVTLQR